MNFSLDCHQCLTHNDLRVEPARQRIIKNIKNLCDRRSQDFSPYEDQNCTITKNRKDECIYYSAQSSAKLLF